MAEDGPKVPLRKVGSLLREIETLVPRGDRLALIEQRLLDCFSAFQKASKMIDDEYPEYSSDLTKRFFNAVRSGDQSKIRRGIRLIERARKR